MITEIENEMEMREFGAKLGSKLRGGEVIELVGDVGAGKTMLTKGVARGLGIYEDVQSPSFTISRVYDTPQGLTLAHYDFYRLSDAGIMQDELEETVRDPDVITIIEWADVVAGVLPTDRLTIRVDSPSETARHLHLFSGGVTSHALLEELA